MNLSDTAYELRRVASLIELGRYREAVAALGTIVASDPKNDQAFLLLAQAHLSLENLAEAHAAAGRGIALAPQSEWGYRLASVALLKMGRAHRAVEAAERCVECAPENPVSLYTLGQALLATGERGYARRVAAQVVELAPEWSSGWALHGEAALAVRHTTEAYNDAQRALQLDPESAHAHDLLGRISLKQRDAEGSLVHLADALQLQPTAPETGRNLAVAMESRMQQTDFLTRIVLGIGTVTIIMFLLSSSPPPLITLPILLLYGYLCAAMVRLLTKNALPESLRPLLDINRHLRHRYTLWVTGMVIVGVAIELFRAISAGGLLPLEESVRRPLQIATALGALVSLLLSSSFPTPFDRSIARPLLTLAGWLRRDAS